MNRNSVRTNARLFATILVFSALATSGCNIPGLPLFIPPLATIQWEQRPADPNFTVRFNATGAVSDPTKVTQINWVFGDGSGFVTGGLEIDHRYTSTGSYVVTAYIFSSSGFVDTVDVTINITLPSAASGPIPVDGATAIPITQALAWTPGSGATTSVVYLSTNLSDVQTAALAAAQGEFGTPAFQPTNLVGGLTYYWRVDSKSASASVAGPVWSFTTTSPPGGISNAMPADASLDVSVNVVLSWTAATGATSRDVYFGTDFAAVSAATTVSTEFKGTQSATIFDPTGSLPPDTEHFWRIDEIGPGGKSKGVVLAFRTGAVPGKITNAFPADLSIDLDITTMMTWTAGTHATSHDFFFGTNKDAVTNADNTSNLFRGNQAGTTFSTTLAPNTTYFWRVDELGPGGKVKGDTLEFKTAAAPTVATDFDPVDDDIEISVTPVLSWTAGMNLTQNHVFFGETSAAVSAATTSDMTGVFKGGFHPSTTTYEPGATTPLTENKEYFWRIDQFGPGGTARGPILSFTTRNPIRATDPNPTHGQENVANNAQLSWVAGVQGGNAPLSHDVYFGKGKSDVTNATNATVAVFKGNFPVGTLTFNPGMLDDGAEYFWRIDERYDLTDAGVTVEVAKGKVWSFTVAGAPAMQATNPNPANNAVDIDRNADLSWTAGTGATSHSVYFGTNQGDVTAGTGGTFRGTFPAATLTFDPGQMANNTDHFWRIDEINANGTTTGTVWRFKTLGPPAQITNPSPADGAVNQAVAITLSWTAATGATSYDVYFGTVQADVTNATTADASFKGNQAGLNYSPTGVVASTTYYWRIDPKNAAGTTTGAVLSFTTGVLPAKATNFVPANNATGVSVTPTLTWTAGAGAVTHDVYFGTDQTAVTNATTATAGIFKGNQGGTNYQPGVVTPLTADTPYYWRIDEVAPGGTQKGDVITFRTAVAPTQATVVAPANLSADALLRPILQWTAGTGPGTISHDVYFGTVQANVLNATRASAEFKQNQGTLTYSPGAGVALLANTNYYWRIDEVDTLGGTTKGVVWQFSTTPATKFVILGPLPNTPILTPVAITIQAQDASNNVVANFETDVTLVLSGSATGGGLVNIVNGVGTVMIQDAVDEVVTLSLSDTQATGLNVTSTQMITFTP